jgi:hypothetical protein
MRALDDLLFGFIITAGSIPRLGYASATVEELSWSFVPLIPHCVFLGRYR